MRLAKAGDHVVKITCRCGGIIVAGWAAPEFYCSQCHMRGKTRVEMVLEKVGWKEYTPALASPPTPVLAATAGQRVGVRRLTDRAVRLIGGTFPGSVVVEDGEREWWKRTRKGKGREQGEGML